MDLHQCIDTPMHQIFQDMVKGLIELIADWFKFQKRYKQYVLSVTGRMAQIARLRLNWCKLDTFTGSTSGTGGWVAESFLGFYRLLPLWYGHIDTICDTTRINIKPLLCLVQSAYACVSHLMTMAVVSPELIDRYVKVFLSSCHELSLDEKQPSWDKGNLLSFLNFQDQIEFYGHLRFYWEGNRERYVQVIKPLLKNMRKTDTYLYKKLADLHIQNALRELLGQTHCYGQWISDGSYSRHKPVCIYPTLDKVLADLHNHLPLSTIVDCHLDTYICVQHPGHGPDLYKVLWSDRGIYICGIWYCGLEIATTTVGSPNPINSHGTLGDKIDYAIITECLNSTLSDDICYYTAFTMNWLIHAPYDTYKLYSLTDECFHDYM